MEFQWVWELPGLVGGGLGRVYWIGIGIGIGIRGISVSAVTAAYGSALTAGYLEERNAARRQVTKRLRP
ncbi:hypothetical protein PS858_02225 [Pseudomonas fluorescens]|jgi:hypothetical protein|nr:hypothetical protein PS676_05089 [Pseudomonas fluorescens]VVO89556.1 hypothetical protein PS858_02225 [Pseudomonas fluorescens]